MAQRPLRRHICESCKRTFYSRSPLSRFDSVQCQVRVWRANNQATQGELEQLFLEQEADKQEGEVA